VLLYQAACIVRFVAASLMTDAMSWQSHMIWRINSTGSSVDDIAVLASLYFDTGSRVERDSHSFQDLYKDDFCNSRAFFMRDLR
jgi:hypothetical protein